MQEEYINKKVKVYEETGKETVATLFMWLKEPEEDEIIILDNHTFIFVENIKK